MELYQHFSATFWNSDFWLPENITWSDIAPKSHSEINYTDFNHLVIYPLPIALVLFVIRRFLEKVAFVPFGIYLGINPYQKQNKALPNTILERSFQLSIRPSHKSVQGLAKQLDWPEIKVERWFRTRRRQDKPTTLIKFSESMWRCVYFSFSLIFGCIVLWDKEWLGDIRLCWKNYPHQSVDDGVWWYYMVSLGVYVLLCFTQFIDVKRSDFWQHFAHHIATIALMSFSWVCNMTRLGSLVLVVHDCPDGVMEIMKCAKYAGFQKVCNCLFVLFVPLWLLTRCGLYPLWILKNGIFDSADIILWFPACYIFIALLLGLLMLHFFWTYLMMKLVRNTLVAGSVLNDIRSGSEDESD